MIEKLKPESRADYDEFLQGNAQANYCLDPAWLEVFKECYGKEAFVLLWRDAATGKVTGAAPGCYLQSPLFGRHLVGMPYLDYGGPVASDPAVQGALIEAMKSHAAEKNSQLELRCLDPLGYLNAPPNIKVAMMLALPSEGSDAYWKKLDAKVRNQVRKAEKSAVTITWGREDKLDEFYRVFCINMRDLGSPVHSKALFASVLKHFPRAQIGNAHREGRCIGGLFRILWKDTLVIPWASTLKEERVHSANNALYWESIRFAFEEKCRRVDFGRSSKEEGTYRFKKQWLAEESPLYWYQFDAQGALRGEVRHAASGKLGLMKNVWSRLPLPIANFAGPRLRGGISA